MPGPGNPDISLTPPFMGIKESIGSKILLAQIESLRLLFNIGTEVIEFIENHDDVDLARTILAVNILSKYVTDPVTCLLKANAFCESPETYEEANELLMNLIKLKRAPKRAELINIIKAFTDEVEVNLVFWENQYAHLPGNSSVIESVWVPATQSDENKLLFNPWKKVEDLYLSVRSENTLRQLGIKFLGELVQKKDSELSIPGYFGKKSLEEVRFYLRSEGAYLGMSHPELDAFNVELKRKREAGEL